jgi:hypothetical protein
MQSRGQRDGTAGCSWAMTQGQPASSQGASQSSPISQTSAASS